MKTMTMLLAGGLICGVLVGGPAQASGGDQSEVTDACGDEFVLVGQTPIGGPSGQPSLGSIVQATDPATRDACAFVTLRENHGTSGTVTITAQSASAGTPDGTWDETDTSDDEIDLDEEYSSDPVLLAYPDAGRAAMTVRISGVALQGTQHDVKRIVVVPATRAERKAAKKAYKKAVTAARKLLRTNGGAKKVKKALKKARDRRDDALDGHEKRVTVRVGLPTPFSTTAVRTFGL